MQFLSRFRFFSFFFTGFQFILIYVLFLFNLLDFLFFICLYSVIWIKFLVVRRRSFVWYLEVYLFTFILIFFFMKYFYIGRYLILWKCKFYVYFCLPLSGSLELKLSVYYYICLLFSLLIHISSRPFFPFSSLQYLFTSASSH